ncbi:hypothetical protein ACEQ8H_000876 [Pleosporales sp. CAS-2024a]
MVFLSSLFGSKRTAPPRVPTDEVIPLFERDDFAVNRTVGMNFTMVFEDVLDADKLSGALWKLLERPGWRNVGSRLRLNDKGRLEHHVPAKYTQDRPPINYTHVVEPMGYRQHPLGAKLPTAQGRLQTFPDTTGFRIPGTLHKLGDYIYTDCAQLGLHVMSFEDATIVTISWLHTLLDALGLRALLRAWQAELQGGAVPDFVGSHTDPLSALGTQAQAKSHVLAPKLLGKLGMLRFVVHFLWEMYRYPEEASRIVVVPRSYFASLRAQAIKDLETLQDKSKLTYNKTDATTPFLSDGDILLALLHRTLARANPSLKPSGTVAVMNIMDMRDVLRTTEPPLLPKEGVYVHNCLTALWSHFRVADLLSLPLGHIAAQVRADLVVQTTRPQIEAGAALSKKGMSLFGPGDMTLVTMSNWLKARMFETDLSAAIVPGSQGRSGTGRPKYAFPASEIDGYPMRRNEDDDDDTLATLVANELGAETGDETSTEECEAEAEAEADVPGDEDDDEDEEDDDEEEEEEESTGTGTGKEIDVASVNVVVVVVGMGDAYPDVNVHVHIGNVGLGLSGEEKEEEGEEEAVSKDDDNNQEEEEEEGTAKEMDVASVSVDTDTDSDTDVRVYVFVLSQGVPRE